MAIFDDPFSSDTHAPDCTCGAHARRTAVPAKASAAGEEAQLKRLVQSAVLRAAIPNAVQRRAFLKAVGGTIAGAALAEIFPIGTATEAFAQAGTPEKTSLKVGFIPITCATPIIMAHPMGFYAKQKIDVEVVKTAGWAVIRDKTLNKEYDAAHMLSPMPIAITLGLGSTAVPFTVPAIENINGQAITLAMKHKDKRDPKQWKGFKLGM